MSQMIEAGWKKVDTTQTKSISDKELSHIFSLIDVDKNGYLGGKVSCSSEMNIYFLSL